MDLSYFPGKAPETDLRGTPEDQGTIHTGKL